MNKSVPKNEVESSEEEGLERKPLAEKLLESRTILLTETISPQLAEDITTKLLLLDGEDPDSPIDLYINSPGGSVDAGFAIYDMIRFISSPVRCICTGLTASAAVIVLLAAKKEDRLSLPNSRFLLHQPSAGVHGSTTDVEIEANQILKIRESINGLISRETGQDTEKVDQDTRRNYWMDAGEALAYGLVNRIVQSRNELAGKVD
ncbi:MAG: ATP-dependent Clp protease proteolytic subunit [Planctomycetes bacterium]|nr:ATP-dependent Clp protease proteolytic subunit [Planctomycetota bacterium]